MNLVRFCENRFQELKWEGDVKQDYDIRNDAEIKAVHQILSAYRVMLKWFLIPKCLLDFVLVKLHAKPEPEPVLVNKMKSDQLAKQAADKMVEDGKVTPIQGKEVIEPA